MATDWTAVENALQAYVRVATGLDNAHCRWADSNTQQATSGPYATLEIVDRVPVGAVPEIVQTDHLGNAQGSEVELAATQVLDCGFRVQVFAPPLRGTKPGTPRGAANAASVAEQVRLAAALPTNMANLDAVGVSIYDLGRVQYVPAIKGTDFEGRAVLDCRFYVADSASEFTGYVAEVTGTNSVTGAPFDIPVP